MKNLLFVFALGIFALQTQAQVRFGLKTGLSTSDLSASDLIINSQNGLETIKLGIQEANYGFQFGASLQIKTGLFFLQPEVLLNSQNVDYRVTDFTEGPAFTRIVNETYNTLDIPVLVGFKLGPIRAGIGPVGKVNLNKTSGLTDFDGIEEDFRAVTFGYQAGFGLNLWKLTLDVRMERSLDDFGEQISVFGQNVNFNQQQNQLSFAVGYLF